MRVFTSALASIIVLGSIASVHAQSLQPTGSQPSIAVPRLIKFSGVFQPADGQPPASMEVVTLSIYAEQEGGVPLWQEIQTVAVDTTGRFTVLLGASHPDGLPPEVFASGEARWMSLEFARPGEVERPRVRFTSVPYALKAEDAETLGGRPASAYLLAPTNGDEARRATGASAGDSSVATAQSIVTPNLIQPGTPNFLAKYVNSADVGNSAVFEIGGKVGIGTTAPLDRLHVRFTNTNGGLTGFAVQNMGNTADVVLGHALLRPVRGAGAVPGLQQRHARVPDQQHCLQWIHQLHARERVTAEDRYDHWHHDLRTGQRRRGSGVTPACLLLAQVQMQPALP